MSIRVVDEPPSCKNTLQIDIQVKWKNSLLKQTKIPLKGYPLNSNLPIEPVFKTRSSRRDNHKNEFKVLREPVCRVDSAFYDWVTPQLAVLLNKSRVILAVIRPQIILAAAKECSKLLTRDRRDNLGWRVSTVDPPLEMMKSRRLEVLTARLAGLECKIITKAVLRIVKTMWVEEVMARKRTTFGATHPILTWNKLIRFTGTSHLISKIYPQVKSKKKYQGSL